MFTTVLKLNIKIDLKFPQYNPYFEDENNGEIQEKNQGMLEHRNSNPYNLHYSHPLFELRHLGNEIAQPLLEMKINKTMQKLAGWRIEWYGFYVSLQLYMIELVEDVVFWCFKR